MGRVEGEVLRRITENGVSVDWQPIIRLTIPKGQSFRIKAFLPASLIVKCDESIGKLHSGGSTKHLKIHIYENEADEEGKELDHNQPVTFSGQQMVTIESTLPLQDKVFTLFHRQNEVNSLLSDRRCVAREQVMGGTCYPRIHS